MVCVGYVLLSKSKLHRFHILYISFFFFFFFFFFFLGGGGGGVWERSGSVVECLTRDRRAAGSSLTGLTALWSFRKTRLS